MPCPWLGSSTSPMAPSRGPPAEPAGTTGPWALPEFPLPSPSPGMGPGNAGIQAKGGRMGHPVPCLAMPRRGMQHHAVLDQAMPCRTMPNHAAMAMPGRTKPYCAGACYPMLSWPWGMDHSTAIPWMGDAMAVLYQGIPYHVIVLLLDQIMPCRTMPPLAIAAILDHIPPCRAQPKQDQGTPCHPMLLHLCCAEPCHAGQCQPTLLRPCQAASCHAGPCHPLLPWPC